MAEITETAKRNKKTKISSERRVPKIDLTPMVDLGFLLITFFVFTTSISKPNGMKIILPEDSYTDSPTEVADSKVLTLLLKDDHNIVYYNGKNKNHYQTTDYGANGIRNLILQKRNAVAAKWKSADETTIIIKPGILISYKSLVAILDEMQINNIKKFVLAEPTEQEKKALATKL